MKRSSAVRRECAVGALVFLFSVAWQVLVGPSAAAQNVTADQLFDAHRVVEVSFQLAEEDWEKLRRQSRDIGKAFNGTPEDPFTYFQADMTIDGLKIAKVGLRKKGFIGSLDERWPSLKVKFDEYVEQAPIPGLDSLTLNNNKQDSSLASQFLTYRLFNAANVQAPRCSYARVTVSGDYLGICSQVECVGWRFV